MIVEPFEEVLAANKEQIYRICKIYATPPYEAQDLFQEVTFQAWKSYKNFEGKSKVSTWIYRVALNVCLQMKTKHDKKNHQTIAIDAIQFKLTEDSENIAQFNQLKACIDTLPESDKSVIVLFLEDLAYREIGNILGLTENHVAVKMKRIKAKLSSCMTSKHDSHD